MHGPYPHDPCAEHYAVRYVLVTKYSFFNIMRRQCFQKRAPVD